MTTTPTHPHTAAQTGPKTGAQIGAQAGTGVRAVDALVVAPGYQAALLPGRPGRTVRWRSVRRDGTRFPPVGELGVVIAQAKALANLDGAAWIVGSDHHTIEIHHHPAPAESDAPTDQAGQVGPVAQVGQVGQGQRERRWSVDGCGPRWTHTVRRAFDA